jgi:putative addiction module CopG family antidote
MEDSSLEQFVSQQLQSGKYQSYEEMIEAGLRLLQECEAELDRMADKLRPAVEEFLSGHAGVPFDAEEIIKQGKERLASAQRHSNGCKNPCNVSHCGDCVPSLSIYSAASKIRCISSLNIPPSFLTRLRDCSKISINSGLVFKDKVS